MASQNALKVTNQALSPNLYNLIHQDVFTKNCSHLLDGVSRFSHETTNVSRLINHFPEADGHVLKKKTSRRMPGRNLTEGIYLSTTLALHFGSSMFSFVSVQFRC